MKEFAIRFLRDEEGQDIVEYSLLIVLVAAVAIFALTAMGQSVVNIFTNVTSKLQSIDNASS